MSPFAVLVIVVAAVLCPGVALRVDEVAGAIEARETGARRNAMIETTLSAWLHAAKECRSYDAKFTRWEYDPVFGDATKPKRVAEGRFVFQHGGPWRYDVPNVESVLWQGDELSLIDWSAKTCTLYGSLDPTASQKWRVEPRPEGFGFLASFPRRLSLYFAEFGVLPHLLTTDHKQFRADYEFRLKESSPNNLVLTVEPKAGLDSSRIVHDRLEYAFSDGRPLPYAVRITNGARTTVYRLHDPQINKVASDAEAFLKPDLSGLRRIDHRDAPPKPR